MATNKQIAANRKNAKMSTGPKTEDGKALVSMNAVQHGLLTKEVLLQGEDEATLIQFGKRMRAELKPMGELEDLLVDKVIAYAWRLRRVAGVEVGVFRHEMYETHGQAADPGLAFIRDGNGADAFSKLSRSVTAIARNMYGCTA